MLKNKLKKRKRDTHKGDYGRVLVIGGSAGMTGAPILAGRAALRVGAGLVYVGVPKSLQNFVDIASLETVTIGLSETKDGCLDPRSLTSIKNIERDVIAVGPGLSLQPGIPSIIKGLLAQSSPLIIDADGLNALALSGIRTLKPRKCDVIITPHPGELSRLLEVPITTIQKDRHKIAGELAKKYGIVVVLKGHHTIVAPPKGKIYVNKTGNPGMASGGMGDVLTGIIASFVGQGMELFEAAQLAVFIHGRAGDLAARVRGEYGLIASDIIDNIPKVCKKLTAKSGSKK